jgi:hypothetical protein
VSLPDPWVRYSAKHNPYDEWVYNAADIDHSKVIWAREMGAPDDLELIQYYADRTVWLVQPDAPGAALTPYPLPQQDSASLRTSSVEHARECPLRPVFGKLQVSQ